MSRTLFIAAALAVLAVGCGGATRAPTKVLRQPILLLPGTQYHLVTRLECVDAQVGPDTVREKTGGETTTHSVAGFSVKSTSGLSRLKLERRPQPCPRPDVVQQVADQVSAQVKRRLEKAGYREAADGVPVEVHVQIVHERRLQRLGKHTDRKKDTTCQKACGQPTCTRFEWKGSAEVTATVSGPPFEATPQAHQLFFHPSTLRNASTGSGGERQVHACNARSLLPSVNDPKRYDWDAITHYVAREVRDPKRWAGLATAYSEQYDLTLFDSGVDHPAFEQGVMHAKRAAARAGKASPADWAPAAEAFTQASSGSTEPKAKGRCVHNLAAVQMVRGELELAKTSAGEAMGFAQAAEDSDTVKALERLTHEIQRRQIDVRKQQARAAAGR